LCATVLIRKKIRGRLYPKAARTGPCAYANEVSRVGGRVVSRYVGIVKVSDCSNLVGNRDVVENKAGKSVVEKAGETDANDAS
jgi:hypothetical protein